MAGTIYINTQSSSSGNGSKTSPYNYLSQGMLDSNDVIYIAADSIIVGKLNLNLTLHAMTIAGYNAESDEPILEGFGPIIYGKGGDSCIYLITGGSTDNKLTLTDICLYGWKEDSIIIDDPSILNDVVDMSNNVTVRNSNESAYSSSWRRITINPKVD